MIRVLTADELKDLAGSETDAGFGSIETVRGCLPLVALEIDAAIEGLAAETTVRQRFRNVFDEPLEATYIFPLPARAAVTGFRMTVNDTVVEGRIDERGKARRDYDAAIAEGRSAAIAEQERADVFTLRVGNIPPKSTAHVELTLAAPLAIDSLEATYRFPLVVAPRYCPGVAVDGEPVGDGVLPDTDRVPDASRISPPVLLPGFKSPVMLGICVRIAGRELAAMDRSPGSLACTLPAKEKINDDGSVTVTVVPGQRLDCDFILRFGLAGDAVATARLLVEPDALRPAGLGSGKSAKEAPGDGTFTLVVVPPAQTAETKQPPRDVVFLLDRSGSMGGWKIVAARRAVGRMIDSLTAEDRVAVLAFDNQVEHLGASPLLSLATDRHRWSLLEWLGRLDARGGTELAAAVEAGLGLFRQRRTLVRGKRPKQEAGDRDRVFVLVTDGQVGDEERVIANLVQKIGNVAFFVVGIDTAVNEGLLTRMADATGGMAESVESESRLDDVMERIHTRLATPLVSGLEIRAAGLEVVAESLVPAKLPNLVPGVPLVVRGRYRGAAEGGVSIEGRRPSGEPWREQAEARPVSTGCHGNLWARGKLRHLEDLHATGGGGRAAKSLDKRIVELSTAFGVLCRFTALIAIDPRHPDRKPAPDAMRRIVQPVERVKSQPLVFAMRSSSVEWGLDSFHQSAPPVPYSFGVRESESEFASSRDARTEAADILLAVITAVPDIRSVKPAMVRRVLEAVVALLVTLESEDAPRETIESLAAAYQRLLAMPKDREAFAALLAVVARIAGLPGVLDSRWQAAPVDASLQNDGAAKD